MSMMLRNTLIAFAILLMSPLSASAIPVNIAVSPYGDFDGNYVNGGGDFYFSIVNEGIWQHIVIDGMEFYLAGGGVYEVVGSAPQVLAGDLTDDVLTIFDGSLAIDEFGATASGILTVHETVLDFGVAPGDLIGSLDYTVTHPDHVEDGSFYFFNVAISENGGCNANGMCDNGDFRLWGNNWDAREGILASDNVILNGESTTKARGFVLGGNVSPAVPEPTAAVLFAAGALIVGRSTRRRR